jgi:YjbE family integral membrane protein
MNTMNIMDLIINYFTTLNWSAVGKIIAIDILLGGDNAVLIALACKDLPIELRKKGIFWGTAGAIIMRIALVGFAMSLLSIPFLKLVCGFMLIWIGAKLITQDNTDHGKDIKPSDKLWTAVKTILIADLLMSVENVIAMAGAAQKADPEHQFGLIIFGILVSIPIVVAGSQIVLKLLSKYPFIVTLGGALLGWIGGSLIISDPVVHKYLSIDPHADIFSGLSYTLAAEIICAIAVYLISLILAKKSKSST